MPSGKLGNGGRARVQSPSAQEKSLITSKKHIIYFTGSPSDEQLHADVAKTDSEGEPRPGIHQGWR